jgi:hypothetical protein
MNNLPDDIILHISFFLEEEEHKQISKTCVRFFWTMWELSTCYWCDQEPKLTDYDMIFEDDFIPVCWFPHPNKCNGGCLGLPWHVMCVNCKDYESRYYEGVNEEYDELILYWNDEWY